MAFSAFVTTVTQDKFVPKVVDNVLAGNVLCLRFLGQNSRPWGSGHKLVQPVKYQVSTSGGSYSGFDAFSTTQVNTRVNAEFDPTQNYFSVVISGIQLAVNKGDAAVVDLLSTEMASVADDMADGLGTQMYSDKPKNSVALKASLIRRTIKELLTSIFKNLYEAIQYEPICLPCRAY